MNVRAELGASFSRIQRGTVAAERKFAIVTGDEPT